MNTIRNRVESLERKLSALETERREAVEVEKTRIHAEYEPRFQEIQNQRRNLLAKLAESASVRAGDVIFKLSGSHARTFWKVWYVHDEQSFSADNIKADGTTGERREKFYAYSEGRAWEVARKAGEPEPTDALTSKALSAILVAGKVPAFRYTSKLSSFSIAGFVIEERATTLLVKPIHNGARDTSVPPTSREVIRAAIVTALTAAGISFKEIDDNEETGACMAFEVPRVQATEAVAQQPSDHVDQVAR